MASLTEEEVFAAVDKHMGGPFKWGFSDCFLAASSTFEELTGIDMSSQVRGSYCSLPEAEVVLGSYGGCMLILMKACAARVGLRLMDSCSAAPIGSIGLCSLGTSGSLDSRSACVKVRPNVWAAKALRGFSLSAQAEFCWNV